ncbi:MAG: hypothetical protein RIR66_747 [Actinomycetota bacterium]
MPTRIRYLLVAIYLSFVGLTASFVLEKPTPPLTGCIETITTGYSHLNLPIELCHVGGSHIGSKYSMLVIGSIHGDEPAGIYVVDELLKLGARENIDLWVIRNGNPDGQTRGTRQNELGVDLNRNFPTGWYPTDPENNYYSGTNPASEPETRALMKAIDLVKPAVLITIHQPFAVVDCSKGKDETLDERLAQLTGLPAGCIPGEKSGSPTNTYTGTITGWANQRFEHTSALALELGPVVSDEEILKYAVALHNLGIK